MENKEHINHPEFEKHLKEYNLDWNCKVIDAMTNEQRQRRLLIVQDKMRRNLECLLDEDGKKVYVNTDPNNHHKEALFFAGSAEVNYILQYINDDVLPEDERSTGGAVRLR